MSAFKGTPGPWVVGRQNNIQTAQESPLDWKGVAQYMGSGQEAEANARLIAAAPVLLEALQDCRSALQLIREAGGPIASAEIAAERAIAKATGGDA